MSAINSQHFPEFKLDEYILRKNVKPKNKTFVTINSEMEKFHALCEAVKEDLKSQWDKSDDDLLQMQKKAIIGYETEVGFYKNKILEYLKKQQLTQEWFPDWYTDLVSGIFHESWGFAGVDEWLGDSESSSCKMIGGKIFFLLDEGKQILQPQKMSEDRVKQLIMALMLNAPEKRMEDGYTEVYMLNGNRITIFDTEVGKEPYIIYRKYTIKQYSFEENVRLGTIPKESIPLWQSMIKVGFNVNFTGAVRTGKTSFLITWQSQEDPTLEGIMIETDPEIPLHLIMPNSPIMQLVADGDKLKKIMKSIMRSDGDYIIMAEARDGVALKIGVQAGNKGTRRMKSTFHSGMPEDFCYDVANEIVQEFGGDVFANTIKVAKAFHYVFHFIQLKDKSKKRLKGVYEIRYNTKTLQISMHQIMKYRFQTDDWTFQYDIGDDKREIGYEEDYDALQTFESTLKELSEKYPMEGESVTMLPYLELLKK